MPRFKPDCNMELQCSLCPKTPKFSDVSHLLTHMSSKGHLAHRFKLQIRSQGEVEARERLENFDLWYHANNLDSLLSDRLAAKEQKKGRKSRVLPCTVSKSKKSLQPGRQSPLPDDQNAFRAPIPRMHLWPTTIDDAEEFCNNDWQSNFVYGTTRRRHAMQMSPAIGFSDRLDPQLNTSWKESQEVNENIFSNPDESVENAKLKGVLWPGMNLFDSATLEQKRMRNQRKGDEVLADMMNTSEQVEPAEVSYHATGEFRASRDIFGPLSGDDSPTRDPTPKKRKSIRRGPALRDLSTNVPRLRATREKKIKKESFLPKKQFTVAPTSVLTQPSLNPLTAGLSYNRQFRTASDEDEEFCLTFKDSLNGKKRGFSILQDSPKISPGRTETPLQDNQFDDLVPPVPGPESHCASDNSLRFQQHTLSPFSCQIGILSGITKTPLSPGSRQSHHFGGKENLQPDMRKNSLERRTMSSSHYYSPQLFYETPLNPLYHHGYSRTYSSTPQNECNGIKSPKFNAYNGDFRPMNPLANAQESASCNTSNNLPYEF